MTAEPSVLGGVGGGEFPLAPANYQVGSLNSKQPVPTLAGEICSFIPKVSIRLEQIGNIHIQHQNYVFQYNQITAIFKWDNFFMPLYDEKNNNNVIKLLTLSSVVWVTE